MEVVTIKAYNKDGELLGSQDHDRPTTIEELRDQFEDKQIVELTWRSHVIDVQRELRAKARGPKTKKPMTEAEVAFSKLSAEEQAKLIENLSK